MTTAAEPATAARQQARDTDAAEDLGELICSDPAAGGIRRRRCGRGFRYLGPSAPVTDPELLREVIGRHLEGRGLSRDRVLAAAVEYAEENGTFGLAAIRKEHVHLTKGQLLFEYTAKSARHREQAIAED